MAPRTGSLAAQLAELSNVAATDYDDGMESDPDALDAGRRRGDNDGGDDSEDGGEDRARSHARHALQSVAPSKMRRQANFIEAVDDEAMTRYQGVKATRKEMLGEEESDDEEGSGDEVESDVLDSEDDDLENEGDDLDNEEALSQASSNDAEATAPVVAKRKVLRFAETDDAPPASTPSNSASAAKAAQSDAALLVSLRQRDRQEAQRGRDARRQTDAWSKLLGVRIRAQKVVRNAGRIATRSMASIALDLQDDDKQALDSTLASLDQLSGYLFQLQDRLLRSYASSSAESDAVPTAMDRLQAGLDAAKSASSKKRALDDAEFDQQLLTLSDLHASAFGPMWREVLAKWSWRTATNGGEVDAQKAKSRFDGGAGAANGLKAVNQSAQEQIERGLGGDAFARLRKRTRVWRGSEKEGRIGAQGRDELMSDDDDKDGEDGLGGDGTREDVDVFDDSDFYAALLRELIDGKTSAGADAQDGASVAWAQAAKRAAKKHRAVDHRSSKGRRLRYDVHEKVENFMPPIPTETWSTEQIQRLVQQLRSGHGFTDDLLQSDILDGASAPISEPVTTVELGGLRLFG